ncbi:MAG: protein-L-isoaspartate(D-aspartate) O-methyltransferase [Brumimicrobium sp.]
MNAKEKMLTIDLEGRGIKSKSVIDAMRSVDRSVFVPDKLKNEAYNDKALPIGYSQTISQPYIVAYMAEALNLRGGEKLLEIGTGSGYNAAVLSKLVDRVYSIETIKELVDLSKENIKKIGLTNIEIQHGDGSKGWSEEAPFDVIELTAAPSIIPDKLINQLKIGGKLLAPVGKNNQQLILIKRLDEDRFEKEKLIMVSFVPLT